MALRKLEQLVNDEWVTAEHRDQFDEEATSAGSRLVIACSTAPLVVVNRLLTLMDEPFLLLWVLHAPRTSVVAGRYQSPPLSTSSVERLLSQFGRFFQEDARSDIWLHTGQPATLVYERHDLIYAYGPLVRFAALLESSGFARGKISISVPHAHNYHPEFDEDESSLAAAVEWRYSPLQAGDDQ
jgi:hypothetical protein